MSGRVNARRLGSYGVDAPIVPVIFTAALIFVIVNAVIARNVWLVIPALFLLASAATYLHSTRRGKFLVWAELLDRLGLRGDERILDMGCGRGAVLLMAAQHLTTGRAVGVDIWQSRDQSGNAAEATRGNAAAEGVVDRVELYTADMRTLPFADGSFDLIVSSLAIHNIPGSAGREKAIDEAVRVLRPGGRLMIADIKATRHHQKRLAKLGMKDVARRGLGWRFWWGGPWGQTRLVTATKPQT
jgi:SAM-dependent methyltransferase